MKLIEHRFEDQLLIQAQGRLDASWSDYFKETMLQYVRSGEHRIILEASGLDFLSSMGIRSLMLLYRGLTEVQGTFKIVNAAGMVKDTLKHSGLGQWLSDEKISIDAADQDKPEQADSGAFDRFTLDAKANLTVDVTNAWVPWKPVDTNASKTIRFNRNVFGFGIGGAGSELEEARNHLGEFVAVGGHVAVQPPDERGRPDYLLSENKFVPTLQCVQALTCQGDFSHQIRFRSTDTSASYSVSSLIKQMLEVCKADSIGFVIIGEIEGMVGASIISSPGKLTEDVSLGYPEIKDWISFCGERLFAQEQAVITGVAQRKKDCSASTDQVSENDISVHLHATVFPYQFIPNGQIGLTEVTDRFFNGPPPKAVLHLVDDRRPSIGLGETSLHNGACWCASINNSEVLA